MLWQEVGWGRGSCLLHNFIDQSGNTPDMELWQKTLHGKDAASSTSSTKRGYRQAWEVRAPDRSTGWVCWCSERGSVTAWPQSPGAGCPARQARWGGGSHSLLRNAGWPQASRVFSKEVLTFVSLRVQQTCAFLWLGVVVGNEEELLCWVFLKNTRRQQAAGTKDFSFPEENSVSSAALLPLSSCRAPWPAFCPLPGSQGFRDALWAWHVASQGVISDLAPSWGLHCVSSAESDQWPSVLLTSGTSL